MPAESGTAPGKLADESAVKRANESIGVVPQSGRITLLTRRLFNILLYFSQQDGVRPRYQRNLSEIIANAAFDSNNTAVVKSQLRKMRNLEIEWNSKSEDVEIWAVSGLIEQPKIIKRKGQPVVVEWGLPENVSARLLDPDLYTRLSLQLQTELRSGSSIALYEICARYATNPSHLTCSEPWRWWRPRLTGNPEDAGEDGEYKYFKRDVLRPAVAEINQISDLEIELVEHKAGKRITAIQFKVVLKRQPQLKLGNGANLIDSTVVERMIQLGLSQAEASEIYGNHDENFVRATLDLVEKRVRNPALAKLDAPAAYFRNALKKKYADQKPSVALAAPQAVKNPDTDMERLKLAIADQRRSDARNYFEELLEPARADLLQEFAASSVVEGNKRLAGDLRKKGLAAAYVEVTFANWLATRLWGEPSEKDLLDFAASRLGGAVS